MQKTYVIDKGVDKSGQTLFAGTLEEEGEGKRRVTFTKWFGSSTALIWAHPEFEGATAKDLGKLNF